MADESQITCELLWPDLFFVKLFLDRELCDAIVAEMRVSEGSAATVYGRRDTSGAIDANMRKTLRVTPSNQTVALITQRLFSYKNSIEKHFNVVLNECEEPQFLRYNEGDFFVAHQDGNTGLLRLETERRRVSIVIFLSRESDVAEPNTHSGGTLVLLNRDGSKFPITAEPGSLVAFRSETTHEVIPVTRGERVTIVSWYK